MTIVESSLDADIVARTRAIIPELRSRADEAAVLRRVPAENFVTMKHAGSLRTLQSTRNGGFGASVRTHLEVVAALSEGCGSTGWCAGVIQAHSWLMSHFPVEAQDETYGVDPDTVISAVIGPRGRAVRHSDGSHTLTGVWPFASGNENSQWLLLGGVVVDEAGNDIDQGDFLIPTASVTRHDDWFVNGLTGTGSCTVQVTDMEVPAHRFLSLPGLIINGRGPGAEAQDGWNHRCAPVPVLAFALTGSALGIARAALAELPGQIKGKIGAYSGADTYTHPITHVQAGKAAMLVHEAELILGRCADEIDAAGAAGTELSMQTRARMRLDCAQGVYRCLEAVEIMFHLTGASGIRLASPLTRHVADIRAINQHGLLNLEMNQEIYGRVVLGLDPGTPLI